MKYFLLCFCYLICFNCAFSQTDPTDLKQNHRYNIKEKVDEIILDGRLDEATWAQTEVGSDFWQKSPFFAPNADPRTEIRLAYDDLSLIHI